MDVTRLLEAAAKIEDDYHNAVIASVNDHIIRMSIMTGPFYWHRHPNSDEFFYVIEGTIAVDFEGETVTLNAGDTMTIPAGVPHRTRPIGGRSVNITCERSDALTVKLAER